MPVINESLKEHAIFATTKRLFCALLNEGLAANFNILENGTVVLTIGEDVFSCKVKSRQDILYQNYKCYLDPDNCQYPIISGSITEDCFGKCVHPSVLFDSLIKTTAEDAAEVKQELVNSVENQYLVNSFASKINPRLGLEDFEYEALIREGHATHPMHRSKFGMDLEETMKYASEFQPIVNLVWISVYGNQFQNYGEIQKLLRILLTECSTDSENQPNYDKIYESIARSSQLMLVHPANLKYLTNLGIRFHVVEGIVCPSRPLASLRTLIPVKQPNNSSKIHVKLSLGVKTTSALRTISHFSVYNGPRLGQFFVTVEMASKDYLRRVGNGTQISLLHEIAGIGLKDEDPDVSKYLGLLIRLAPESLPSPNTIVSHIVVASLVETNAQGIAHVNTIFKLKTFENKIEFFAKYVNALLHTFLPPFLLQGVCLEGHGQNSILIVESNQDMWKIIGFAVRDYGGIRVFQPMCDFKDFLSGSCIVTDDLDECLFKFFHCIVQCNLNRMIRALALGWFGWNIVRESLVDFVNKHNSVFGQSILLNRLQSLWLDSELVPMKCFIRMKIVGKYRDYVYQMTPNVLNPSSWHYSESVPNR